jgi:hypothetical protein
MNNESAKYIITGEKHPTKTKGGDPVYLITKYGKEWAWLNSQQYHNFYHNGRIYPKMTSDQLA